MISSRLSRAAGDNAADADASTAGGPASIASATRCEIVRGNQVQPGVHRRDRTRTTTVPQLCISNTCTYNNVALLWRLNLPRRHQHPHALGGRCQKTCPKTHRAPTRAGGSRPRRSHAHSYSQSTCHVLKFATISGKCRPGVTSQPGTHRAIIKRRGRF